MKQTDDLRNSKVLLSVSALSPLVPFAILHMVRMTALWFPFALSTALQNKKRHMLAPVCQFAPAAYIFGLYFWKET